MAMFVPADVLKRVVVRYLEYGAELCFSKLRFEAVGRYFGHGTRGDCKPFAA